MKNKKKGFTLAEVLITLGIIGVVAAITLPTLMQDASKQQLGVKLAKFSSNIEKITRAAAVEEELTKEEVFNILNEELLFGTDSSGATKDLGTYSASAKSNKAILRDGTMLEITAASSGINAYNANSAKYGSGVAQVRFFPEINGLSGVGPEKFLFVVTSRGFVFPCASTAGQTSSGEIECLQAIYDNKYKATKIYGIDSRCKTSTPTAQPPRTDIPIH